MDVCERITELEKNLVEIQKYLSIIERDLGDLEGVLDQSIFFDSANFFAMNTEVNNLVELLFEKKVITETESRNIKQRL